MRTNDYELKSNLSPRDSPNSVERFEGFHPFLTKNLDLQSGITGFIDSHTPATRPRIRMTPNTNSFPPTAASCNRPMGMTIEEMDQSIDQYLTEKYNAYCLGIKRAASFGETECASANVPTLVAPTPEKSTIFKEGFQQVSQPHLSSGHSQDYGSYHEVLDLELETEEDLIPIELARARSDDLLMFRPLLSFGDNFEFDTEEGILGAKEIDRQQGDNNSFIQCKTSLHQDDSIPPKQTLHRFHTSMTSHQFNDYDLFDLEFGTLVDQGNTFPLPTKLPPTQATESRGSSLREDELYTPSRRVSVEPHSVVSNNAEPPKARGSYCKNAERAIITPLKKRSEAPQKKSKPIKALKISKQKSKQGRVSSKPKTSKNSPKTQSNTGIFGYVPKVFASSMHYDGDTLKQEPDEDMENPSDDPRFRDYQVQNWVTRFQECKNFVKEHGHCYIPHDYPPSQVLSRWAKRQRYQYKLYQQGSTRTSMTAERVRALEGLGFCWDAHKTLWQERYQELKEFVATHGHANVPTTYKAKPKLATWVKCQRRQYKVGTRITDERVKLLEDVGFKWEVKPGGRK